MEEGGSNETRDGDNSGGAGAENLQQQQAQSEREQVLEQYRAKIREHREVGVRGGDVPHLAKDRFLARDIETTERLMTDGSLLKAAGKLTAF